MSVAIPRITIHLNGVVQPITLAECESVTIRLPTANLGTNTAQKSGTTYAKNPSKGDGDRDEEESDLMDEVDCFLDDNDAKDEEDAPDWEFKEGEVKSKDLNYVFCPVPPQAAASLIHKALLPPNFPRMWIAKALSTRNLH
jgi:hypothetical protein